MPNILFCSSSMNVIPGIEVKDIDSTSEVNDLPISTLMASLQILSTGLRLSSNSVVSVRFLELGWAHGSYLISE